MGHLYQIWLKSIKYSAFYMQKWKFEKKSCCWFWDRSTPSHFQTCVFSQGTLPWPFNKLWVYQTLHPRNTGVMIPGSLNCVTHPHEMYVFVMCQRVTTAALPPLGANTSHILFACILHNWYRPVWHCAEFQYLVFEKGNQTVSFKGGVKLFQGLKMFSICSLRWINTLIWNNFPSKNMRACFSTLSCVWQQLQQTSTQGCNGGYIAGISCILNYF